MPERVQQRRTKGWRKPENTVSVARPSKWGNPFAIGHTYSVVDATGVITDYSQWRTVFIRDATEAVARYAEWLTGAISLIGFHHRPAISDLSDIEGKNLMCWCPLPVDGEPDFCHADVLLALANAPTPAVLSTDSKDDN